MAHLLTDAEYAAFLRIVATLEGGGSGGVSVVPGYGFAHQVFELVKGGRQRAGKRLIWVKITANETGGGKYQGKSYTHDGTADVAATGNVAESELGTVSATVDCRVLNFAEEGETTHDLTAGTVENDTFLCHWYRTNSDGIKVCAVVAFDRQTCT